MTHNNACFSVVIPTHNSAKALGALLCAVAAQTLRPELVLVVDSDSSDGTRQCAEEAGARVKSIALNEFDHGNTRTLAGKETSGEFIVYLTSDALVVEADAFEKLLCPFNDAEVGAVFGRQIPAPDASLLAAHLREFNYPAVSYVRGYKHRSPYGIKAPFLSNCFCAYRRSAMDNIGWFRDGLILGEDTYAGAKLLLAGYKIAYAADAVVRHSHNYSPGQEFRRYFDIGVFHSRDRWILREFGRAESQGFKYLLSGIRFLRANGALDLLPAFFIRALVKYGGYLLGYGYKVLPINILKRLSMHRAWWGKEKQ